MKISILIILPLVLTFWLQRPSTEVAETDFWSEVNFEVSSSNRRHELTWAELLVQQEEINAMDPGVTEGRWVEIEYDISWDELCSVNVDSQRMHIALIDRDDLTPDQQEKFNTFRYSVDVYHGYIQSLIYHTASLISRSNCMEDGGRIVQRLDELIVNTNIRTNYGETFGSNIEIF